MKHRIVTAKTECGRSASGRFFSAFLAAFLSSAVHSVIQAADSSEGLEFFEKRIRPIFVEICYECHSAEKKTKGGLRLDSRAGWTKGGDSGPALIPGQPDESLLIKAVQYRDEDLQMPPKRKLTDTQIADLEQWVKLGAPDPREGSVAKAQTGLSIAEGKKFWAYQPPRKSLSPAVKDAQWPYNDIDRFILAALETRGLPPVPVATKATLARRAYFDLTGLPPTPEQIDAFVDDARPDAFARLVDRLLASSQFGERWGRHWLDVSRFAESVTLRGLVFKEAWRYRDYVIESFHRDAPFDRFVREQIAGDLLPAATLTEQQRQRIATTFLALGNANLEEQDKKQLDMDVVDEQLDTIGKAFLAQTIGCARCHDHKFDPIPTSDYYALAGILSSTKMLVHANVSGWVEVPLPVEPEQEKILQEYEATVAALQAQIKAAQDSAKALAGKSGEPKADAKNPPGKPVVIAARDLAGVVVDSAQAKAIGEWKHSQYSKHYIGDGYWHDLDQGKGQKTLSFLPEFSRAGRYEVRFAYVHAPNRAANVPVTIFHADGETTVHINQQEAPVLDGRFVSLGQFRFEANGFGHVLVANEGTQGYVTADAVQFFPIEDISLTNPPLTPPRRGAAADAPVPVPLLGGVRGGLSSASPQPLADGSRTPVPDIKALQEKLKQFTNSGPKRPMVMSVKEEKPSDTRVHIRGSVHNLAEPVPRGFLTVATCSPAPSLPANESGRRELADWLASPENPLTARVLVNRVWHWLFGSGLVRTTDNFGTTGERPSHPELLDYLAIRFMEEGWSVKKLLRQIMLSHTYQLSTASDAHALAADPENRLLWRMNRRRLDAESIRDAMLQVSGELRLDLGGRTIPPGLSADYGFKFNEPRRSVYVPVFRNALPELFEVFDFADPSVVTGRRNISTVSPQALFLMNHPFVQEQAQGAARGALKDAHRDVRSRVDYAYRLVVGRGPTEAERELALKHLAAGESEEAWTQFYQALFGSLDFRYLN